MRNEELLKRVRFVDNLISTETDKALSANQGKVLKDKLDAIVEELQYSRTDMDGEEHDDLDSRLMADLELIYEEIRDMVAYSDQEDLELRKRVIEVEKMPLQVKTIQAQIDRYRNVGFKPYTVEPTTTLRLMYTKVAPTAWMMDTNISNFRLIKDNDLEVLDTEIKDIAMYTWGYDMVDKNTMYSQEIDRDCYEDMISGEVNVVPIMDVATSIYIFIKFKNPTTIKEIQTTLTNTNKTTSDYYVNTIHLDDDWELDKYPEREVVTTSRNHSYGIPTFDNAIGYDIRNASTGETHLLKFFPYKFDLWDEMNLARLGTQSLSTMLKGHDAYIEFFNKGFDDLGVLTNDLAETLTRVAEQVQDNTSEIEVGGLEMQSLSVAVAAIRGDVDTLVKGTTNIDLTELTNARTTTVDGLDKGSLDARITYDIQHLDDNKLEISGGAINGDLSITGGLTVGGLANLKNTINFTGFAHSTAKQALYASGASIYVGNDQLLNTYLQTHRSIEAPKFMQGTVSHDLLHTGTAYKQKVLTQDEYDAIATKDANTLYFIKETP